MALSEEERRRLEKLEQALASSDPDLDRRLQTAERGKHDREAATMVYGIFTLIAALTLVIVGIATELILIGVAGFLLIMAGFLLQWPTLLTLLMFPILTLAYTRLAISEEREVRAEFGSAYEEYAARTPRFIPRLRPHRAASPSVDGTKP